MKALLLRSRTIWGSLITALGTLLPLIGEQIPALQVAAVGIGLPDWTKHALSLFGIAMVVYARWSDHRSGENPA